MGAERAVGLSLLVLATGCGGGDVVMQISGPTMGATYVVKWVARQGVAPAAERVRAEVEGLLAKVNTAFSTWDDDSVISRFNAHASTAPFTIPAEHRDDFLAVTRLAQEVAASTHGAFDPTVQPLCELLGFGKTEREAPSDADRAAALARVGWQKLQVGSDGTLRKAIPDLQITYSALVPGWTADRIADLLHSLSAGDCMVDVGGEILCRGCKPNGSPWTIGIERPSPPGAPSHPHTTVALTGGLATSGDYRNFHLVGDRVMHHLLDPRTGDNVRHGWASVSVRAESAGLADALATAFMVLGPDAAEPIVVAYAARGVRALFLSPPDENGVVRERRLRW